MQVKFNNHHGILTVWGVDELACERVFAQVQRKIASAKTKDARMASMMTVFHEIGDGQKAILTSAPYGRNRPYILSYVRVRAPKVLHLARLENSNLDLEQMMNQMSLDRESRTQDWRRFSKNALLEVVQKSLDLTEKARLKRNSLEFNISPGKLAFNFKSTTPEGTEHPRLLELTPNQDGIITKSQLEDLKVISFFNPLLHPSLTQGIAAGLAKAGFECLNPDKPEQLTIVHLLVGENRKHFTVALALDQDLHPLKENLDPRLDEEKRKAMEKIFQAKTIGEVLEGSGNPKVVSVKTQKKKMSNITFFSDQFLDLRASLTAFDKEGRFTFFVFGY